MGWVGRLRSVTAPEWKSMIMSLGRRVRYFLRSIGPPLQWRNSGFVNCDFTSSWIKCCLLRFRVSEATGSFCLSWKARIATLSRCFSVGGQINHHKLPLIYSEFLWKMSKGTSESNPRKNWRLGRWLWVVTLGLLHYVQLFFTVDKHAYRCCLNRPYWPYLTGW